MRGMEDAMNEPIEGHCSEYRTHEESCLFACLNEAEDGERCRECEPCLTPCACQCGDCIANRDWEGAQEYADHVRNIVWGK
jgi:hypothetical protein